MDGIHRCASFEEGLKLPLMRIEGEAADPACTGHDV